MQAQVLPDSFHAFSRQIVSKFLQTVIVVDDKPILEHKRGDKPAQSEGSQELEIASNSVPVAQNGKSDSASPSQAPRLRRPMKKGAVSSGQDDKLPSELGGDIAQAEASNQTSADTSDNTEVLFADVLNKSFASKGLICGVLKPYINDTQQTLKAAKAAARRADIVVLDWKIEDEPVTGDTAISIIKQILDDDENSDPMYEGESRLRLISIYTNTPILTGIILRIDQALKSDYTGFNKQGDYTLVNGSIRICVFQKGKTREAPGIETRTFDEEAFVDRIIDEFTYLTKGLLSNVAIGSLGALRENTHKILQKFSSTLDAPYLTHRALSNPIDEVQHHPVSLLSSEIQDVLMGKGMDRNVSSEVIELWLKGVVDDTGIDQGGKYKGIKNLHENLASLAVNGIAHELKRVKPEGLKGPWWDFIKTLDRSAPDKNSKLTELINGTNAKEHDRDYAILNSVRSHYDLPPPQLTLGSIVCDESMETRKYYVCIQPVCDAVRIGQSRAFPLLLLKAPPAGEPFDIVIKDQEQYLDLKTVFHPYLMEMITFGQYEDTGIVYAENLVIKNVTQVIGSKAVGAEIPKVAPPLSSPSVDLRTSPSNQEDEVTVKGLKSEDLSALLHSITPPPEAAKELTQEGEEKGWYFFAFTTDGARRPMRWVADLKFAHSQRIVEQFSQQMSRVGLTESEWQRRNATGKT